MTEKDYFQLARQACLDTSSNQLIVQLSVMARKKGIFFGSIDKLYQARARQEIPLNFTVPAVNIRGLTFMVAQAAFRVCRQMKVGAVIFELARSEMEYTDQTPVQYACAILAAALANEFCGPIFLQGDHYQIKKEAKEDIEKIKALIKESIIAGFYNIDIDGSTLVDYSYGKIGKQQQANYLTTASLAEFIRSNQPEGLTVSIGGEIGHIGGKNSTEEELRAFIKGFSGNFSGKRGLSKISVQTGTHHGGVVLPNGQLAKIEVDFDTLKKLAVVARSLGLAGTVQHGASTLPDDFFKFFPSTQAIEIHLATGFQNLIFDHPSFPANLKKEIYAWVGETQSKDDKTDEQFIYSCRKKAWGKFKRQLWDLPQASQQAMGKDLEKRFSFLFNALRVENTKDLVGKYVNN